MTSCQETKSKSLNQKISPSISSNLESNWPGFQRGIIILFIADSVANKISRLFCLTKEAAPSLNERNKAIEKPKIINEYKTRPVMFETL